MLDGPYFPFMINKNIVKSYLHMIYRVNKIDQNYDYFTIAEKLHEIARAISFLSEQELDDSSKRLQKNFDVANSLLHINILITNINQIASLTNTPLQEAICYIKQIKSSQVMNEEEFSLKIQFVDSSRETIRVASLVELLDQSMQHLLLSLKVIEKNWFQYIQEKKLWKNLSFADYITYVKIFCDKKSKRHLDAFNHFYLMSSVKYSDQTNINALDKYLKAVKLLMANLLGTYTSEAYENLLRLAHIKTVTSTEKEDLRIMQVIVNGRINTYFKELADFVLKNNRTYIFNRLYWEDELSAKEKYGLYFLAVYFENLNSDSTLNELIPNEKKYRMMD